MATKREAAGPGAGGRKNGANGAAGTRPAPRLDASVLKPGVRPPRGLLLTARWLAAHGACREMTRAFRAKWPKGLLLDRASVAAACRELDGSYWAAHTLLGTEACAAYEAATEPAEADADKACEGLRQLGLPTKRRDARVAAIFRRRALAKGKVLAGLLFPRGGGRRGATTSPGKEV